ncbi:DUF427 domain-containing protein [Streptomyces sp. NBC_01190]|uniref:DUF427 domain-containing protein n=1 Tax=Streptomyces sp. NBC_01190 TaxID=2903767 RepID=UPI0038669BE3|nr:DUF427 domain-containing protein [Streptomyces sp. NBC_01190]
MTDAAVNYPSLIVPVGHVEPAPRRVRGFIEGLPVFDTQRALYVWEWPAYPQYCVPVDDLAAGVTLADEDRAGHLGPGPARRHALRRGSLTRPGAAWVWADGAPEALAGTARFTWDAVDEWFEEDERIFVHPRSPYTHVDALRSNRPVRIEIEGTVVADAPSTVMVFETGLPTRYYLDRVYVDWTRLDPTDTVTACPYKGTTSGYWSFGGGDERHTDVVWAYDFPTRQLAPIAGLVAFYNEKVDLYLDGVLLPRPAPVSRAAWEAKHRT